MNDGGDTIGGGGGGGGGGGAPYLMCRLTMREILLFCGLVLSE